MTPNTSIDSRITARIQRWRAFFAGADAPRCMYIIRPPHNLGRQPQPRPDNLDARIDWACRLYEYQMDRLTWLDDDLVPHLDPYTGTELFAEAFGCPVHYPEDNMPHARPLITSASEVATLQVPDLSAPALERVFHIADTLRARCGAEAVMRMVDVQSPMGIAALIWDKSEFYPALIEEPEAVRELADKVKSIICAFLDEFFSRYGRAFIAHCPEYYLDYGMTLSDDEVGVVSPAVYQELFLPDLIDLSQRYGAIGIHCCADSMQHWPAFQTIPNVRLWNLRHLYARQAYTAFTGVAAQMHGCLNSWEECETIIRDFPGARIVFDVSAKDRDDARRLADKFAVLAR